MSSKTRVPTYRKHKQSGQAIVTLVDAATRRRRDELLGKHGTKASRSTSASCWSGKPTSGTSSMPPLTRI